LRDERRASRGRSREVQAGPAERMPARGQLRVAAQERSNLLHAADGTCLEEIQLRLRLQHRGQRVVLARIHETATAVRKQRAHHCAHLRRRAGRICANRSDRRHRSMPTGIMGRSFPRGAPPLTGSLSRRRWLQGASASALLMGYSRAFAGKPGVKERLEAIRKRIGGRLGVHVLDTHTGERIGFDDNSRYATASTFKMLLAAAVLKRVDTGEISLTQRISYSEKDMLKVVSPVTAKHVAEGSLSVQDLCAAIVEVSDNTAANLLLKLIGGPPAITKFARELGDEVTRLDRTEPELNTNIPGDPRDTTSPRAMVGTMQKLFTGGALSSASVNLLNSWMIDATPGLGRIRAGIPKNWKAGDKTGTGANGAVNDLAILWPPGRKPILIAIYMSESTQSTEALTAAHAEIARTLFDERGIVVG
jgi:beta-lactamase class A